MDKKLIAWKPLAHNEILQGENFYISYNQQTRGSHGFFTELGNMLGSNLKDGEETALYDEVTREWMILEGDFRKEYEKAFPKGLGACKKVFKKYETTNRSNWSTAD